MRRRRDGDEPLRPPQQAEVRREINRSGSGGSGGPDDADALEEGSGSESLADMLGGGRADEDGLDPEVAEHSDHDSRKDRS